MNTYKKILNSKKGIFALLIDPEKITNYELKNLIPIAEKNGVDVFFVGGSTVSKFEFDACLMSLKKIAKKPVVIFPGNPEQISKHCDALLFLSLFSGRNPKHLVDAQVFAAPIIKKLNIETISTAYLLIDGGVKTAVQKISETEPLNPKNVDLIVAHAIAAELLGFKLIYLEAGSGAKNSVPNEVIRRVAKNCSLPIIVGGGIKNEKTAREKILSGAKIVVIGNYFEDKKTQAKIKYFAQSIHN